MKNVPLIYWAALALAAGIASGTALPWPSVVVMIACLLAIILAIFMLWKPNPNRGAKSMLAVFFLFGLAHSSAQLSDTGPSWIFQKGYCPVTARGQIVSIPERVAGQWGRFILNINEIDGQAVSQAKAEVYCQWPEMATGMDSNGDVGTNARVEADVDADSGTGMRTNLEEGSLIVISGKIRTAQAPANPGESDERLRHRIAGIKLRLEAWDSVPRLQGIGHVSRLRQAAINLRARLKKVIAETMSPPEAALLNGIMLGSKEIPIAIKEAFEKTGAVHILSVSGLHVSLVAAAVGWLLKKLRVPNILVLLAVSGCIWLYILMCGLQPPALRSGIMTVASLTGSVCARRGGTQSRGGVPDEGGIKISGARRLVLAAIILLLINPLLMWDAGFQLSFFATAGIFMVGPILLATLQAAVQRLRTLRRGIAGVSPNPSGLPGAGAIACSLGVFLTVLPLNAIYFNCITPIAIISNIIVVPLASAALYIGLIAALSGTVFLPAALWLNSGTVVLLKALAFSAEALARIPGGTMVFAAPDFPITVAYYAILICAIYALYRKINPSPAEVIWHKNTPRSLVLAALAIVAILAVYPVLVIPRTKLTVVDVGQGCAVLIQFSSGTMGLIDCGPAKSSGESIIANLLRHYGVSNLDFIMISHGHADHCGAMPALMQEFSIKKIILPSNYQQRPVLKRLANNAALLGISVMGAGAGSVFASGKVCIEVLWPLAEPNQDVAGKDVTGRDAAGGKAADDRATGDENSGSLTLRIRDQGRTLLLPGDLGAKELSALAKALSPDSLQSDLKSDAWVVAHHGSAGSYCPEFYRAANPTISIVSVGSNNVYGHPSGAVLEGLVAGGSRILLTSSSGAITLKFNRDALTYHAWRDRGLFGLWRWRKNSDDWRRDPIQEVM